MRCSCAGLRRLNDPVGVIRRGIELLVIELEGLDEGVVGAVVGISEERLMVAMGVAFGVVPGGGVRKSSSVRSA